MNNILKKNKIERIAIIISKPLDVYNAYLFINQINLSKISIKVFAMEGDINDLLKKSVNKFFPHANLTFFRSGDFYSLFIKNTILNFDNKKNLNGLLKKLIILKIKTFAYIFSKIYWIPFFFTNFFKNRKSFYDLVITDPWASKIFYWTSINSKYFIFQDGGSSTETFRLLDPLFQNSSKYYSAKDIVLKSLDSQKVKLPFYIKNFSRNKICKISNEKIFFATKLFYLNKSYERSKNKIDFRNILEKYGNSIIIINELKNNHINFVKDELYMILGKEEDAFYAKCMKRILLKLDFKKIYIRPHPMGNTQKENYPLLNNILKMHVESISFLEPKSSFEESLLSISEFPKTCILHSDCSTNTILSSFRSNGLEILFF